jgi:uncharacterized membrane protein YeaQ/YmgE (transglycosylase-associated protein family)
MALLIFAVFGFFAGLLARALMPGKQKMGLIMTSLLGMAGSFVGGLLSSLVFHYRMLDMHPSGFIGSVIGALVLLAVGRALKS